MMVGIKIDNNIIVNLSIIAIIALLLLMPELGFCEVPVIGKLVSKTKELTEQIKKFLLGAFGLYIICAGVMFLKNPDMLANHMFKIISIGMVIAISYGATTIVEWFVG